MEFFNDKTWSRETITSLAFYDDVQLSSAWLLESSAWFSDVNGRVLNESNIIYISSTVTFDIFFPFVRRPSLGRKSIRNEIIVSCRCKRCRSFCQRLSVSFAFFLFLFGLFICTSIPPVTIDKRAGDRADRCGGGALDTAHRRHPKVSNPSARAVVQLLFIQIGFNDFLKYANRHFNFEFISFNFLETKSRT